jgi:dUTPase
MVTIQVKNIEGKTVLPVCGTERAAGYDIVAVDDPIIVGETIEYNGETYYKRIDYLEYHTALYISPQDGRRVADGVPEHCHTLIHPRSSVRKYNLLLANSIGLIDNDYRGEILVCYKYVWQPEDYVVEMEYLSSDDEPNHTSGYVPTGRLLGAINTSKIYKKGDKVAQLVASQTIPSLYEFVSELDQTNRGEGGFGHTDTKTKILGVTPPSPVIQPAGAKPAGGYITELYKQAGGIPIKQRYIDEIKQREN